MPNFEAEGRVAECLSNGPRAEKADVSTRPPHPTKHKSLLSHSCCKEGQGKALLHRIPHRWICEEPDNRHQRVGKSTAGDLVLHWHVDGEGQGFWELNGEIEIVRPIIQTPAPGDGRKGK